MPHKRKQQHQAPPDSKTEGVEPVSPVRASKKKKKSAKQTITIQQPLISIQSELQRLGMTNENSEQPEQPEQPDQPEQPIASSSHLSSRPTKPLPRNRSDNRSQSPPRIPKSKKGKETEVETPEAEISVDEEKNSDSDSDDVEFEVNFKGLDMDRETTYGSKVSYNIITEFENRPELYFEDHMAPYRGLMSDMKHETQSDKDKAISKLYSGKGGSKRILVAASGKSLVN
jgi:hypothetical protein